jgi:hypothetical protein
MNPTRIPKDALVPEEAHRDLQVTRIHRVYGFRMLAFSVLSFIRV